MKRTLIALFWGLGLLGIRAHAGIDLSYDGPNALKLPEVETSQSGGPGLTLSRRGMPLDEHGFVWSQGTHEEPYKATLFRIAQPKIGSSHYVLTGEVAYKNLPTDSELELWGTYLGGNVIGVTDQVDGAQKVLSGSSDFRPFMIPISAHDQGALLQLEIIVSLGGFIRADHSTADGHSESLSLRNLQLVDYPDASGFHWKSFWIGVMACAAALVACVQLVGLGRRWKRARHDRELRSIASQDS